MLISLQKSNQLKSIAILMMLFLHLFNRDYHGLFQPVAFVGAQPLSYYLSLFSDACVPIFAFVSGYGLYLSYSQKPEQYFKKNIVRIKSLYLRYWIIILLFVLGLGYLILHKEGFPGSFLKLFLTITAIDPAYNGAWWFFTVYVLFVLTSCFWFSLLSRLNPWFYLLILLLVYIVAFYFRIYKIKLFDDSVMQWLHRWGALYFCTLLQFMLGAFAVRFNWSEKFTHALKKVRYRNGIALIGIVLLIVFHGVVPNFIVAPFTALAFIFLFLQLDLPSAINKTLDFFTPHATNIWLVHMFFYMIFFPKFIYGFTYVLPIFLALIMSSVLSSYLINAINKPLQKWV